MQVDDKYVDTSMKFAGCVGFGSCVVATAILAVSLAVGFTHRYLTGAQLILWAIGLTRLGEWYAFYELKKEGRTVTSPGNGTTGGGTPLQSNPRMEADAAKRSEGEGRETE